MIQIHPVKLESYLFSEKQYGQLKEDSQNLLPYAFPDCVFGFIWSIVQGDIKGEIMEVQK